MSHRYRKQAPSTQLYRHFAVVTVVLTGLLAVFAEGEKAEALTYQSQERRSPPEAPAAGQPKAAPTAVAQRPGGLWGDDGGAFGVPAIGGASLRDAASSWWPELSSRGYSSDYLARLSEEERQALEAAIAENAGASPSADSAGAARLEAASRARSGSVGRD